MFAYGFAIVLLIAGTYHFINPTFYYPFMPAWFPKVLANAAGGIAEIGIGLLMLFPASRTYGLYAAVALMLLFLPLHLIDLLRDRPVIGSKTIAVFRLLLQFVLIAWLFYEATNLRAGPQVQ